MLYHINIYIYIYDHNNTKDSSSRCSQDCSSAHLPTEISNDMHVILPIIVIFWIPNYFSLINHLPTFRLNTSLDILSNKLQFLTLAIK